MEVSSRWLSFTMIFWLPVIYLTTYLGFYEAYELARSQDLFSLNYSENYPVFLIVPAMIPTMFTAYTIINRKRMMFDVINKFDIFHEQTVSGDSKSHGFFLSDSEFRRLTLEDKFQYCVDLNTRGEYNMSTKLRERIYTNFARSKKTRERAIANMAKSGMQTLDSLEEEFEYSKLAFELIKDEPKDRIFFKIMSGYIADSVVIGYEESLKIVEEIDSELSPEFDYWKIRLQLRKLYLIYRMNPEFVVNFDQIEAKMNLHKYSKEELQGLEQAIAKLKKEVLLKQNRLDEFKELTLNRIYLRKWMGKRYSSSQSDLARMYRKQGEYDKSLMIFKQLQSLHLQDKSRQSYCVSTINIGKTHFAKGDFENAMNTCEETLELSKELEYHRAIIESLTVIVNCKKRLDLEHEELQSELEALIREHGIEADPD